MGLQSNSLLGLHWPFNIILFLYIYMLLIYAIFVVIIIFTYIYTLIKSSIYKYRHYKYIIKYAFIKVSQNVYFGLCYHDQVKNHHVASFK